ncbi:MAG: glycoside hydrolase family 1 protein [Candidatus Berkelbacteria bacterium]|nr:glycoside hydrolase family 1 protein [Candidatus Berkelbacteria bacterium]
MKDKFFWGAATSSHQVEGNNTNQWSKWEKEKSGRACDHYHLFEEDFKIAKSLGHNAHRFSIEWSRIEPEENKFDEKEIKHYQKVIDSLREKNIEPFVTLWHWTLPLWLPEKGGFARKNSIDYFARYVEKIVSSIEGVKFWITINEPDVYASKSYLVGDWPPQKQNIFLAWRVIKNLIKAHKRAYEIIKEINPGLQVGIAKHNIYFEAYKNKLFNRFLKKGADWVWNYYILNKIGSYQDFIGLNYYLHNRINWGFNKNENLKVSDLGWELYPEGIYYCLKELQKYKKPIYITENGLADAKDKNRAWYIKEIIKNIFKAKKEGIDVHGYLHWSLLDNFEWDKGFWPRFGLVEVDYKTLKRKIRPSALEYKKIIEKLT